MCVVLLATVQVLHILRTRPLTLAHLRVVGKIITWKPFSSNTYKYQKSVYLFEIDFINKHTYLDKCVR